MKESQIQTILSKHLSKQWGAGTAAIELKLCKKNSVPFNAVQPHQVRALQLAKKKLVYKIGDTGGAQKPFDCFILMKAKAYVAICWYRPRKMKYVTMIDIDVFATEEKKSDRKSITMERAKELAEHVFML